MVTFELHENATLTDKEKMLAKAKSLPVTYDEDSPMLTDRMEQAFIAARKKQPYSLSLSAWDFLHILNYMPIISLIQMD